MLAQICGGVDDRCLSGPRSHGDREGLIGLSLPESNVNVKPIREQGEWMKPNIGLLSVILVSWLVCGTPSAAAAGASFSYSGDDGPGFWAETSPACGATPLARQSPVNIVGATVDPALRPLVLSLNETSFTLQNNGHTVVATPRVGGTLTLNGVRFALAQFHFHTLSEHTVAGKHAEMELHAVFANGDASRAVIAVLYKIGREDPFLGKLLTAGLPPKSTSDPVSIERLNLAEGLTNTAAYYTYPGSLTTPPCDANVTWIVLKQSAQMSEKQFEAFQGILGNNFRSIQKLNARRITETPERAKPHR
ncbi:MAG TPA: carbonic anhydrase family protein [Bryobacteraceae bacterium]|nr:carbonic anhydrase family protein [Bryobacteraceae bacterium]